MVLYIGWIIAAFLAGLLFGKWPKKQKMKLKERFDRLNICMGMSYVEILQRVEAAPRITDRNANGVTERTWVEEQYSIFKQCNRTFDHQAHFAERAPGYPHKIIFQGHHISLHMGRRASARTPQNQIHSLFGFAGRAHDETLVTLQHGQPVLDVCRIVA